MTEREDPVAAFFTLLKQSVLSQLENDYKKISVFTSFKKGEEGSEQELRARKGESREWVSFAFDGYDFWNLHLGIVWEKKSNRIVVGFHISEKLWAKLEEKIRKIPWENYPILKPTYRIKEELSEHRFEEPEILFRMEKIGTILQEVIDKALSYYRAASEGLS
jgi:hypothetical protein